MDHYKMRRMFGKKPALSAVLVWATQQALKGIGVTHPDTKRQRTTRQRDVGIYKAREMKRTP